MFALPWDCPLTSRPAKACSTFVGPRTAALWQRQPHTASLHLHSAPCLPNRFQQRSVHSLGAVASSSPAETDLSEQQDEYLEIGNIITTHGVRGELKVQALTDFPEERLMTPGVRWLQTGTSGPVKECFLEGGRSMVSKGREIWVVKLRGITSLNDSELLKGQTLLVRSSDRLELEDEDDFLVQDLIGSTVFLQEEETALGIVTDVYDGTGPGAHDFLCISLSEEYCSAKQQPVGSRPLLLPFAKEFVPIVDHDQNCIHVCPPPGLLELAFPPKTKQTDKKVARNKKKKPSKGSEANKG